MTSWVGWRLCRPASDEIWPRLEMPGCQRLLSSPVSGCCCDTGDSTYACVCGCKRTHGARRCWRNLSEREDVCSPRNRLNVVPPWHRLGTVLGTNWYGTEYQKKMLLPRNKSKLECRQILRTKLRVFSRVAVFLGFRSLVDSSGWVCVWAKVVSAVSLNVRVRGVYLLNFWIWIFVIDIFRDL